MDRRQGRMAGARMMINRILHGLLYGVLLAGAGAQLALAAPETYPDGHGGEVAFPEGDVSFADAVLHYDSGSKAPRAGADDPQQALGIPDYDKGADSGFVSLGCGGTLVLKLVDNALVDIAGPDLYVFEIGPDVEPTGLAISSAGDNWTRVGGIEGGKAEVDIAPYIAASQTFRYIKLVDLKSHCGSSTPGADVDAVGAIGSAQRIALSGEVLFDTGKYQLKPAASQLIDKAFAGLDKTRLQSVTVAGYTDAVGSDASNQVLSENRARTVAQYLVNQLGVPRDKVSAEAHGESQPVASNDTASGRAQNRRVEITIRAQQPETAAASATATTILGMWEAGRYGIVELRQANDRVEGSYTEDNGRIRGRFTSPTVFEGYWIEDGSGKTCTSEKAGSKHWGVLRLEFSAPDRDEFDGKWRYCGEQDWHGSWPHAKRLL